MFFFMLHACHSTKCLQVSQGFSAFVQKQEEETKKKKSTSVPENTRADHNKAGYTITLLFLVEP